MTGWNQLLTPPKQELFQVNLAGAALLVVCKVNIWYW